MLRQNIVQATLNKIIIYTLVEFLKKYGYNNEVKVVLHL